MRYKDTICHETTLVSVATNSDSQHGKTGKAPYTKHVQLQLCVF